ncbi:MAG: hypothetical protein ABJN24_01075 [Hyphomicrobiales bacterium]
MRQTTGTRKSPGEKIVKDIKRATRKREIFGQFKSSQQAQRLLSAHDQVSLFFCPAKL